MDTVNADASLKAKVKPNFFLFVNAEADVSLKADESIFLIFMDAVNADASLKELENDIGPPPVDRLAEIGTLDIGCPLIILSYL
jgi:hypothetical protein